jgi:hypothetical protein
MPQPLSTAAIEPFVIRPNRPVLPSGFMLHSFVFYAPPVT